MNLDSLGTITEMTYKIVPGICEMFLLRFVSGNTERMHLTVRSLECILFTLIGLGFEGAREVFRVMSNN